MYLCTVLHCDPQVGGQTHLVGGGLAKDSCWPHTGLSNFLIGMATARRGTVSTAEAPPPRPWPLHDHTNTNVLLLPSGYILQLEDKETTFQQSWSDDHADLDLFELITPSTSVTAAWECASAIKEKQA